ncbi:hypothetical protein TNCT_710311, partial [Trichonephila clavata]
ILFRKRGVGIERSTFSFKFLKTNISKNFL